MPKRAVRTEEQALQRRLPCINARLSHVDSLVQVNTHAHTLGVGRLASHQQHTHPWRPRPHRLDQKHQFGRGKELGGGRSKREWPLSRTHQITSWTIGSQCWASVNRLVILPVGRTTSHFWAVGGQCQASANNLVILLRPATQQACESCRLGAAAQEGRHLALLAAQMLQRNIGVAPQASTKETRRAAPCEGAGRRMRARPCSAVGAHAKTERLAARGARGAQPTCRRCRDSYMSAGHVRAANVCSSDKRYYCVPGCTD